MVLFVMMVMYFDTSGGSTLDDYAEKNDMSFNSFISGLMAVVIIRIIIACVYHFGFKCCCFGSDKSTFKIGYYIIKALSIGFMLA